jgi:D-glycero-D-manno-heptose 1,7-bisphosphate phosphatase
MARSVVFLDRDGTINVDHGYVHRIQDWDFIPGAIEAIRDMRLAGYAAAVVSNQSAVASGAYALVDVARLHDFMLSQLAVHGTTIDAIAVCPHRSSDSCPCRKPRTGLALAIEEQLGVSIDYSTSWTIGDKLSDIGFGRALGTKTILLRSQYWKPCDLQFQPDHIAESLLMASSKLVGASPATP